MNAEARQATVERRIRTFYFFRADGSLCGRTRCTDHPGFEEATRRAAAEQGHGVLECEDELDLWHDQVDVTTGKLIDPRDHAFAADLEAKWQRILGAFPMLAHAVPPTPAPKSAGGTQRFSVSAFWQDFAQRAASGEWRLRAPTDDLTDLAGPFRGHGVCLEPVFKEGHIDYHDPTLPAQDGDIVLVKLDALECQRIHERNRHDPQWVAMYGEPNPLCVKLLKAFAGNWWLVTNDSMFELGKNRVLGVLRRTFIDGRAAYEVPCILPNAATETFSDSDDFAGAAFGTATLQSFTYTPPGDCIVEVSGFSVADNALADSGNLLRITVQPTAGSKVVLGTSGTNDTSRQQHAYVANYSATGGVEITVRHETVVGGGNPSIHVWQANLRLAVIKR